MTEGTDACPSPVLGFRADLVAQIDDLADDVAVFGHPGAVGDRQDLFARLRRQQSETAALAPSRNAVCCSTWPGSTGWTASPRTGC